MKIANSTVAMSSQHSYTEKTESKEYLKVWNDNSQLEVSNGKTDIVEISDESKSLQVSANTNTDKCSGNNKFTYKISDADKLKITLIKKMMKSIKGEDCKIYMPFDVDESDYEDLEISFDVPAQPIEQAQQGQQGWGLIYNRISTYFEAENTSFSCTASVKTEDGRTINTNLQFELNRIYMTSEEIDIRMGDALKDPLVINYGTHSASVTNEKYGFDIDADGTQEQISFVGQGSGFLALDKNQDGKVNDGSELFGTISGDGFSDLAKHDIDQNGWIDENDRIFYSLKIWSKDALGNDILSTLKEKNIGAIYLGNANTDFKLNDVNNNTNAQIRKTGIFLTEDGVSGTIQHIDLAV